MHIKLSFLIIRLANIVQEQNAGNTIRHWNMKYYRFFYFLDCVRV